MPNILTHEGEEPILLSARALRRLLERGNGDAALLYLALLRHQGAVQPRSLAGELRWDAPRTDAAERILRELELISPDLEQPVEETEEPTEDQFPYQQTDIASQLEDNAEFRQLTGEVESRLGKRLTTPDLARLLGLLDDLGLPSDVVYTLVCHCTERTAARYGEGRRPTMKQIEKTGYQWARMGIDTQTAAAEYLKRYARREEEYAAYMRVLRLGDRLPVKSEEKYLSDWREMGFPAESVALAYDKTVFNCHEFSWKYCNKILKRWHLSGLHTAAEIEKGDRPAERPAAHKPGVSDRKGTEGGLRKYVQQFHREHGTSE